MPVLYIYLGRKGGGAEFNRLMYEYLAKKKCQDAIFLNSLAVHRDFQKRDLQNIVIFTPTTIGEIPRHFCSLTYAFFKLIKHRRKFNSAVLLMASPWDLPVIRLAKLLRKEIIMLVHDLNPHPGEKWPRKKSIAKRIKLSKHLVFLGNSTANQYINSKSFKLKPYSIINHPVFFKFNHNNQKTLIPEINSYILFIGRLVEYKGLNILNDALRKLNDNSVNVLIAGKGHVKINFPDNVKIINKWLSEHEIIEYIRNAKAVIFPYTEASQSGLIPICMFMQKHLIISDVEGLVSQTLGYKNLSVFKSGDSQELNCVLTKIAKSQSVGAEFKSDEAPHILTEEEFAQNLHDFITNCG